MSALFNHRIKLPACCTQKRSVSRHLQLHSQPSRDRAPLFAPEGLGLDSIDALQLVVALERKFGAPELDPAHAREVLYSLNTLHDWLTKTRTPSSHS